MNRRGHLRAAILGEIRDVKPEMKRRSTAPVMASNVLARHGLNPETAAALSDAELLAFPNFGKVSLCYLRRGDLPTPSCGYWPF